MTDKLALRCLEGFPLCIKRHSTRTLLGVGLQTISREEITVQLYGFNKSFLSLNNVEKNKSRAKIISRDSDASAILLGLKIYVRICCIDTPN